jgi:CheY-like chemotaxis protein
MKCCGEFVETQDGNAGNGSSKDVLPIDLGAKESGDVAGKSARLNGHGELIMVVDDEVPVRKIVTYLLQNRGYRVITAENGAQAVAAVLANKPEVRVVVIDMVMPLMDGIDTIRAMRTIACQIPIIVISGFLNDEMRERLSRIKPRAVLSKPFSEAQLLVPLREILDGNLPSSPFQGPSRSL